MLAVVHDLVPKSFLVYGHLDWLAHFCCQLSNASQFVASDWLHVCCGPVNYLTLKSCGKRNQPRKTKANASQTTKRKFNIQVEINDIIERIKRLRQ